MVFSRRGGLGARDLLLWLLLLAAWEVGSGQLHYSIPEEAKHGTFVGRVAQDLGLELAELVPRLFRVASKTHRDLLEVNLQNGILFVNSRIDREELCQWSAECSIHLELIADRPLQVFHVEVKVKDINDNPPVFRGREQIIFIPESRLLNSRFPIEGAADADIGANALLTYTLSPSDYFSLDVEASDELSKSLWLELRKYLDREETPELHLLLTATDGGKPELQGTVELLITVLDVNDNAPLFDQAVYRVHLLETTANGTLVTTLNASDADEGVNGEVVFSFDSGISRDIQEKFKVDSSSGEIRLIDKLDYEETKSYEIQVKAVDKGSPPMSNHCKVLVKVLDVNDNAPELAVTSLYLPIREDAPLSTVIALITVSDRDSGANGQVTCSLMPHVPFKLVSTFKNYYSLVLDSALDRESLSVYELVVTARDGGSPSLWATARVSVEVADVNDNAPAFAQPEYTVFVKENNPPGCHIFTVSARDADAQENALVSYSLVERRVGERALSNYVSVHAESGKVYALQPLDHEELELLQFQPRQPNPDWRYSASLRAGMHSSVHLEEAGILRAGPGGPDQQWPTVSSATPEPEAGEVSPPVGAGVNSNSWTFKYGPGNPKQSGPGELPDKFIIPGSPAIISIRQEPTNSQIDKSDFITFGKKEETKKKKKKKKGNKTQEKKEKGNSTTDNSDQ
ncbi:protocadherin alpha 1 [Homo sapiens]|uniref:Isoform 2 of Protocadherin alpha-1 n=1 Tax=Homo sapiens TaxID=9606 RepID=Q9Y5I3-2|nr:protocadherin alpha-1 isoform 3 precursor [Homo sapiens]AAF89692.1 protocadherin alpha 1 alternate isoform [Homo sapiens]AAI66697.1 Protocadherin alpha 1 [synthetic construct]KAI2539289.1 protocadherin alpha 1 [Homo sapiens]KAI4023064.1 protocadherin alpha 1 [Homo sapiens]|eukprot:NP_113599.1 protocadherin alpha-1 isoform 3 precursor [Homo sapiens]